MPDNADGKIVLTYETIYELLRRERGKEGLQPLDSSFFSSVLGYLTEKQKIYDDAMRKTDLFSLSERDTITLQLQNIRRLVKELYERREKKIIDLAVNKSRTNSNIIDTSSLLVQERELFNSLVSVLDRFRAGIVKRILELKEPDVVPSQENEPEHSPAKEEEEEVEDKKTRFVKFKKPVQQFVGSELELYGPFEADAKAYLPREIADILIGEEKAIEIDDE